MAPHIAVSGIMTDRDCKEAIFADKELERTGIPEGVKMIREGCFSHGSIKAVRIPESVQEIAAGEGDPDDGWNKFGAFHCCEKLHRVSFAEGCKLKEISYAAFYRCKMLRIIVLPEGLEVIGDRSFYGAGLAEITIPKNTRSIGESAF